MDKEERGPGDRHGPQQLEEQCGEDDRTAGPVANQAAQNSWIPSNRVGNPGSTETGAAARNDDVDARKRVEMRLRP